MKRIKDKGVYEKPVERFGWVKVWAALLVWFLFLSVVSITRSQTWSAILSILCAGCSAALLDREVKIKNGEL